MKRIMPTYLFLATLLIGLPLAGVWLAGHDIVDYLEFPPRTQRIEHAPFSWPVFIGLTIAILATMLPFLIRIFIGNRPGSRIPATVSRYQTESGAQDPGHFPWWGWTAIGFGIFFWVLAWTRLSWAEPFQLYTFTPQWICYIVVLNALTWRKTGRSLLTHKTKFFLWLFPLSAGFWWFFEYLNRFVQNWWYKGGENFTPLQYFIAATLPFATVLPAVLSTEEWLASHPRNTAGLDRFIVLKYSKSAAWAILAVSALGLFLIGWFPDYLYPLLWVAPLLLLTAFQRATNQSPFFPEVEKGDWRRIYRLCLAALICGFFWELWNWHSLAQWIYSVPYVSRFKLFEMPLLGYGGYLPFGLECAVIADIIRQRKSV